MTGSPNPASDTLPELGPWLGRLPEVARRDHPSNRAGSTSPDLALDPVRVNLVTTLFEHAERARAGLEGGKADAARPLVAARSALAPAVWLRLWRDTVSRVVELTLAAIDGRIERAARRSGAPKRRWLAARPDADQRAMIAARFDAAGAPLEREVAAMGREPDDHWLASVRRSCSALEDSWDELERMAQAEVVSWQSVVQSVDDWRPPRSRAIGLIAALAGLAGWLGLTLGGLLPTPGWLRPFSDWFWSLPWP